MKRVFASLVLMLCVFSAGAQQLSKEDSAAMQKPKYWKSGAELTAGFSQLSLTNWAAGGSGQISLNTFADIHVNYLKDKIKWENQLQLGYGFIQSFETGFKKSDDRLILDSKWGYKAVEKLYISAVFNLRSQFAPGYNKEEYASDFFAPANISLGLGVDYTPNEHFSFNLAPLTGKTVIVRIPELRSIYGNADDQMARFELGAQLKADARLSVSNFNVNTTLTLFSDYLNKPQNIKINWDANIEAKISRFFSVTLRTNLIYDDTVKIAKKGKDGEIRNVAGVQFKEIFSVGLTYSIGNLK